MSFRIIIMTDNEKNNSHDFFLKEIDIIQSIIKRMSHNSFLIKGWTLTLVVVSLLLKGTQEHVFLAIIPLITFWLLDSYFLRQERLYRKLYEWVIKNRLQKDDELFSMKTDRFKDDVSKVKTTFSPTILWFYGTIAALVGLYACIVHGEVITLFDSLKT